MTPELVYLDTCRVYDWTPDVYGSAQLGESIGPFKCMYEQTTGYQHGASQDAIVGVPRLALPPDVPELKAMGYRLEEKLVQVNPFGANSESQWFKVTSVSPARDLLLGNTVHHLECALKKVESPHNVS